MTKAKKEKRADKAYLKAVEEIERDRVNEVKVIVKQVLEGIVAAQKERKAADEKLALLKQDLDDIRAGRIEKIKARHADRRKEAQWVPFDAEKLNTVFYTNALDPTKSWSPAQFTSTATATNLGRAATAGTFNLSDGTRVNIS